MARPKKSINEPSARERIENAFWDMLAEDSYSHITVAGLAQKAGVNHNTIYYYYENIDDMAIKLFNSNLVPEIPRAILAGTSAQQEILAMLADPHLLQRCRRAYTFICSDSEFLVRHAKKTFMHSLLNISHIDYQSLPLEDKIDLEFIVNGMIALIAHPIVDRDPLRIYAMTERPLGQAVIATLNRLTNRTE